MPLSDAFHFWVLLNRTERNILLNFCSRFCLNRLILLIQTGLFGNDRCCADISQSKVILKNLDSKVP